MSSIYFHKWKKKDKMQDFNQFASKMKNKYMMSLTSKFSMMEIFFKSMKNSTGFAHKLNKRLNRLYLPQNRIKIYKGNLRMPL